MHYRLLGPLEVLDGERPVALGGPRQRAVLALLLLHAGQIIPRDRVVEEVWSGSPPDSAEGTLRVYVSHLRRLLEPGRRPADPPRVLVTQGRGYGILVGPEEVDRDRFERLLHDARRALAAGEHDRAAAAARAGLALWRGRALADFVDEAFAEAEARRLEELRLAALELRLEADLALGRHAELVGELEVLVGEEPLRERLWAQLMTALYRCGRQADALRAYQRVRDVLGEELGIDPGPELRALEVAVLRQQPELDVPRPPRTPAAVPGRVGPPSPLRPLVARDRLVSMLACRWQVPLVTVVAGPGFGKTSLLAEAVRANAEAPAGSDVWLTCQAGDDGAALLAGALLQSLGVDAPTTEDTDVLATALADALWARAPEHLALVVDDVHHVGPGTSGAALLTRLLDRLPTNGHLVLAGRRPPPLPIAALVARGQVVRVVEDDLLLTGNELDALARARGVAPDVLRSAAGWPALAELTASVGRDLVVEFLWEEVLASVAPHDRGVLAAMAAIGPVDEELVAAIAGRDVDAAALVAHLPLVTRDATGSFAVHPLWQEALGGELPPAALDGCRRRVAEVLVRRGDERRAMRLLAEAAAWDDVRDLVRAVCQADHPPVPTDELARWLDLLPAALRAAPEGLLLSGVVLQARDPAAAMRVFDDAATTARARGDVAAEAACIGHQAHIAYWQEDTAVLADLYARVEGLAAAGHPAAEGLLALGRVLLADAAGDPAAVLDGLADLPVGAFVGEWAALVEWVRATALLSLGHAEASLAVAERALALASPMFAPVAELTVLASTWFVGRIDEVLERSDAQLRHVEAWGTEHNVVVSLSEAAHRCALVGDVERARRHLDRAGGRARAAQGSSAHARLAFARAALAVATDDEATAADLLRAELAIRPLGGGRLQHSQNRRLALPYVLVPETRRHFDALDLGPAFHSGRELARALVSLRDHGCADDALAVPATTWEVARAHLPLPWVSALAAAAAPVSAAAARVLAELGPDARRALVRSGRPAAGLPAHELRVRLLGGLEVERDGVVVAATGWGGADAALLCLLAAVRRAPRSEVAAALWPELPPGAAAARTEDAITGLRARLGDPPGDEAAFFVRSDGTDVWLTGPPWLQVDAWELDEALGRAEAAERRGAPADALSAYRAAVHLYRGDAWPDGPDLPWVEAARRRLRRSFAAACTRAGELALAARATDEAAALAVRATLADPDSAAARRLLAATGGVAAGR